MEAGHREAERALHEHIEGAVGRILRARAALEAWAWAHTAPAHRHKVYRLDGPGVDDWAVACLLDEAYEQTFGPTVLGGHG